MDALPIDPLLPEIAATLARSSSVVLEAPPGAGKTTRVPRALLDAGLLTKGEVVILEPRRLAARLAAKRVADELGERLGETVGYQVRFEELSSPRTKIRFVTEGVLTRRLLGDPTLRGVGVVLLDEFHERHLQGDLGLALLRRLQETTRPDLKLAVMSATLNAGPIAEYLQPAPTLRAEGRRFDVTLEHLDAASTKPLHEQVANGVKRLLATGLDGDVLVFLPGAGEIRRAMEACAPVAEAADLVVLPLHGELSPEDQDRAVRKHTKRKVILSTNVAESSVTIDGVVAVIDSGLARVAGHSPWSGLSTLRLAPISRASATQRAGRAGRTRPGRCLRLYTKADFDSRPAHDDAEIRRTDLAQTTLELFGAGVDPRTLRWFEAPPKAHLDAAESLLQQLGALKDRRITPLGQQLSRLPVHPRLARLVIEANARGAGREGCILAALLGERDIRESSLFRGGAHAATTVESDPVEQLELFLEALDRNLSPDALRSMRLEQGAVRAVERARKQLERIVSPTSSRAPWKQTEESLRLALLAAFPDRVAKRRTAGKAEFVFAAGGSGSLGETSGVRNASLVVAVDAEERKGGVVLKSVSAIEPEWLIDLYAEALVESVDLEWNSSLERVDAISRLRYGAVILDESATTNADPSLVSQRLFEEVRKVGPRAFCDPEALDALLARATFAAKFFPETGAKSPDAQTVEHALRSLCESRRSFDDLREASFLSTLAGELGINHRLTALAPESLTLPGGRKVKVHYEPEKPPWVESRLQDFFGMANGPTLGGRVPLVLHLLAPNQRAVQVTTDLAGFWDRHYPSIRKELMRQYPRHSWPENPRTASPPVPGARRPST
jgi:ATP-dependent helicase HrpB